MPGGDRTGPAGFGPMTGRRAGFCTGYAGRGFMNPAWSMGGGGSGGGRSPGGGGWHHRRWYYAAGIPGRPRAFANQPACAPPFPAAFGPSMTDEQELDVLKKQAKYFERALEDLQNRINEIEPTA